MLRASALGVGCGKAGFGGVAVGEQSAGVFRTKAMEIAATVTPPAAPRTTHAARQPTASMRSWVSGLATPMPRGMPMKKRDMARPRLRTNHLAMGMLR